MDLGREPLDEEVAADMDIDVELVRQLKNFTLEPIEEDFQLKFKLTIKNHELEKARLALNLTQEQLSLKLGMPRYAYGLIESCRKYPNYEQMTVICKYFKRKVDELFPEWLSIFSQRWNDNQNKSVIVPISRLQLNNPEVLALESGNYEEMINQADSSIVHNVLSKAIADLTPREVDVLRLRFQENNTLQETGKAMGVTQERIRQIEAKAKNKNYEELVSRRNYMKKQELNTTPLVEQMTVQPEMNLADIPW